MTRPAVCYLAGPMSGLPEFNVPAFREAAARLRAQGFRLISPVELGEQTFGGATDSVAPEEYLRVDLRELVDLCTQIALLPGWELSIGARCEVAVAITLGFEFFDAETGAPMPTPFFVGISESYRPYYRPGQVVKVPPPRSPSVFSRAKSALAAVLTTLQEWFLLLLILLAVADAGNVQEQQELDAALDQEGF